MEFKIHRLEEWNEVIDALLPHIKHNILLMRGNLGARKTTFTQFLLKKLGSADEVSSPTYAIVNEYHSPRGRVNHFDLYRMKSIEEVYDIGIEEYLDNAFLNIIEWAEIYEPALEGIPYHSLSIEVEEGVRRVVFE